MSPGLLRLPAVEMKMRTDSEIQRDVEDELKWNPNIQSTDIAVKVIGGTITLTGFVRSYREKYDAERIAKRIRGVRAVANDLEVKLPGGTDRPDPEIARDAADALKRTIPYTSKSVKAVVRNGWVTLEGDVEWNFQRQLAEATIRSVKGIKGITNLITVKPTVRPSDVKEKIEEALRRSAEVDARNITVETSGDEVTLRGRVRSWAEREEAERAAWRAPGVHEVHNEIEVDPALQEARTLEPA